MRTLHTLLLLLFTLASYSQTTEYNPLTEISGTEYTNTYAAFKKAYIAKLDSQTHYDFLYEGSIFFKKMNYPGGPKALASVGGHLSWIKENIESTSFESYEEAQAEWDKVLKLKSLEYIENEKYHLLFDRLMKESWGQKIIGDVIVELKTDFPEKFTVTKNIH